MKITKKITPDNTVYLKRHVSQGDYQQRTGKRSEKIIPTGKLFGLRKFDLMKTVKGIGIVKGKRSTGCRGRLRIPHFRRIKNPRFSILEKGSRIVSNAENGGMAIDTRFVFARLEH